MEILHIYGPDGSELPSEDLSTRTKSILICRDGSRLALSEAAAAGAEVVAALVRNEDGWALASSKPDVMVTSGPKSAPDMQLLPGLVCGIAGYSFRLERDKATSGCMLLWRYDRSKIVADGVIAGRNIVAENAADGRPCVNPALAGDTLFEFFPAADGIDVVTGAGEKRTRQSISARTLFAVGGFEAMYLSSEDAAAAMKSPSPFSWPSRKPRRWLLLGLLALFGLCALVGMSYMRHQALLRQLAIPRCAQQVAPMYGHVSYEDASDRETIFELHFYRSLPLILGADPSPIADDLIRAGQLPQFTNNVTAARRVRFLQDVKKIQLLVRSGRWDELRAALDGLDREMFTLSDAQDFHHDAVELLNLVNVVQPTRVCQLLEGKITVEEADRSGAAMFANLQTNNLFMTGATLKRERARSAERRSVILAFLEKRRRFDEKGDNAEITEIAELTDAFCALRDQLTDSAFASALDSTVKTLQDAVRRGTDALMKLKPDAVNDLRVARLSALADLGGQLGIPEAEIAAWRTRAKDATGRLALRYQQSYQLYRLKIGSDRDLALKTLEEMIAIGFTESPYYRWALREKERVSKK